MKTKLLSLALGLAVFSACSNVEDEVTDTGVLELKCGVNTSVNLKSSNATPSTDDFVVTIKDAQNATIKTFDPFSSAPDQVELIAGRYNVEAYSQAFTTPAFDMPVYGAVEPVDVVAGKNKTVALNCTQSNAGVKFLWTEEFKAAFSEYAATVTQSSTTLEYPKTETRTGYFAVGNVDVVITLGTGDDQSSFSKTIAVNARELVSIKPVQSDAGAGTLTIEITIDTDVTEREEIFVIGGGNGGGTTGALIDEDFESGKDYDPASINGWTVAKVQGDRDWQIRKYTNNSTGTSNNYAQASAHNGAAADYEYWLISPAVDMDKATSKILTFETAKAYWQSTSSLEVYVLDGVDPATANKEKIDAKIAAESDADHTFISSGDIDLAAQTGTKYIGFRYVAKGGASNSTTFRIDNFKFGEGETSGGDDNGGDDNGGDDNGGGDTGSAVMTEDFADATGTSAWTGNTNFPTVSEKVYAYEGAVKLGSSSTAGSMETKALDLSGNSGAFTVSFKVKGWTSSYDTKVIVVSGSEEKTIDFTSGGKDGDYGTVSVSFTNGGASSTIVIKNALKTDAGYEGKPMRVIVDDFKVTN